GAGVRRRAVRAGGGLPGVADQRAVTPIALLIRSTIAAVAPAGFRSSSNDRIFRLTRREQHDHDQVAARKRWAPRERSRPWERVKIERWDRGERSGDSHETPERSTCGNGLLLLRVAALVVVLLAVFGLAVRAVLAGLAVLVTLGRGLLVRREA